MIENRSRLNYGMSQKSSYRCLATSEKQFARTSDSHLISGVRIRFLSDSDPGLSTSNEGRFLKYLRMNILVNFKTILLCFHTFGVRCPRSVKLAWIRIRQNSDCIRIQIQGCTAYRARLTQKVCKQKKKAFKII